MKILLDKLSKSTIYLIPFLIFTTISLRGDVGLFKTSDNSTVLAEQIATNNQTHPMVAYTEPKEVEIPHKKSKQIVLSRGGDPLKQAKSTTQVTDRDKINQYVKEITSKYNVDPYLIMGMVQIESEFNPKAKNGNCLGLMQVSQRWHADRAKKLGVTDFYDPYSNVLLGVDYISELLTKYKDPRLALMLYNMEHNTALRMYNSGQISTYAKTVLANAEQYRKGE